MRNSIKAYFEGEKIYWRFLRHFTESQPQAGPQPPFFSQPHLDVPPFFSQGQGEMQPRSRDLAFSIKNLMLPAGSSTLSSLSSFLSAIQESASSCSSSIDRLSSSSPTSGGISSLAGTNPTCFFPRFHVFFLLESFCKSK